MLDVGGKRFATARTTLLKHPDTYFSALLGSGKWAPDADGSYFIDRSPKQFELILEFLRTGKQPNLSSLSSEALEKLREDVDYYQVPMDLSPPARSTSIPSTPSLDATIIVPSVLFDSTIVPSLPASFAAWLPGKTFRLLYRASRDGFQAAQFHARCDNQGPTLVVIRSTNNYVFGGYAGASWASSGGWINALRSFLFSLTNPSGTGPHQFFCCDSTRAFYAHSSYGPVFGSAYDLCINDKFNATPSSIGFPSAYSDTSSQGRHVFMGSDSFFVSELEVFAVQ